MEVNGQLHSSAALPHENSPWYTLDRKVGELHSRSGGGDEERNS